MQKSLEPRTCAALARFNEQRYGLFIHWGLYAQAGGVIRGKNYHLPTEWIMAQSRTAAAEYLKLADEFNPIGFDADAWMEVAKAAGIRYVVFTAKHHDGFAMFDSKVSPHTITAATAFGRDPLKELAEAAARHGIALGLYYSQYQDWIEANGGGNDWEFDPAQADFPKYFDGKVVPQVTELLSNYGPIQELWFDTPMALTPAMSEQLYRLVKSLQPDCLVNSRVGNGWGDYTSPGDHEILAHSRARDDWEAVFTLNNSWGYSKHDTNYKSADEVIRLLALCASRGGNFVLNVGPDERGRLPEGDTRRLRQVGAWLARNGESIYGTSAANLPQHPWGVATARGNELYLHVLDRPGDDRLTVAGLGAQDVDSATLLADGAPVPVASTGGDLEGQLPSARNESADVVVKLTLHRLPRATRSDATLISRTNGRLALDVADAQVNGEGTRIKFIPTMLQSRQLLVDDERRFYTAEGLKTPDTSVSWPLRFIEAGEYRVTLEYASSPEQGEREAAVSLGGQTLEFRVFPGTSPENPAPVHLIRHPIGIFNLDAGETTLSIYPCEAGGELFALRSVYLTPVK